MSFETSFVSIQPKLEPKLVSALSETKRLFRLFRFYTETERFDVSIEPKQTEDQPKQFDRGSIFCYFLQKILGFSGFLSLFLSFFRFFFVFFCLFQCVSVCFETVCFESVCFSCFASIPKQRVSISTEPKQTEDPPKQFKREYIWVFFRVVSVCYKTVLFVSVVSI